MRNLNQNTITQAVLDRIHPDTNPRLKVVLSSLVNHLHDFAREVALTEDELMQAIQYLTAVGQKCDDKRQEFILLSDVLGLSMLTVALNNDKPPGCTEATVFGPFYVENEPEIALGGDAANGAPGEPCWVEGQIKGPSGEVIPHAQIHVWQADADGFYDVQKPELQQAQARAKMKADAQGRYYFKTIVAEAYPIPTDGPVGDLLHATGRHPWRPAHLHFMIKAPGYETLITHVFRDGDTYLDSDAVFGVRQSLVAAWVKQEPDAKEGGATTHLHFDFVLNPI
jgi:hydroxyquinol 1,2-dioxygenase